MGKRPIMRCSRLILLLLAVGCQLPERAESTTEALAPHYPRIARAVPPETETSLRTHHEEDAENVPSRPANFLAEEHASGALRHTRKMPKLRPMVVSPNEDEPPVWMTELPPITEPPGTLPTHNALTENDYLMRNRSLVFVRASPPGEFLPPIPALPDNDPSPQLPAPRPLPPPVSGSPTLPPLPQESFGGVGPIDINGQPIPFEELAKMVDGSICPGCGGSLGAGGCASCGGGDGSGCAPGRPCPPGARQCEPFPAKTAAGRLIGLVYQSICCPDPCYQPRWEPIADAAFFVDAVRPKSSTRFRWDYGYHFAYPDRGEFFFARADGNGKGPRSNSLVRAIPYIDYHELYLITEIAMGNAGVQIAVPYRSVNSTPFGPDGAGFADMTITAKTLLLDSELAMFGFQMRTYIPIGNFGKGLGTGHVSLEPGLLLGLRLGPSTYLQSQVGEWIPLGGDSDYQGPHLRWGMSLNQVLWQPVKDVKLIGTLESTGFSFQDGQFTDPVLGPQRLSDQTAVALGAGLRLFFCDILDVGLGWQHGISGKYMMRDQTRFEVRYRY
ncbi:MAG: transporter [Planctomycetia bacterium]|nr:transporter [Planctomycetia bacterium]